jgi:hypothetical protein
MSNTVIKIAYLSKIYRLGSFDWCLGGYLFRCLKTGQQQTNSTATQLTNSTNEHQ